MTFRVTDLMIEAAPPDVTGQRKKKPRPPRPGKCVEVSCGACSICSKCSICSQCSLISNLSACSGVSDGRCSCKGALDLPAIEAALKQRMAERKKVA